MAAGELFSETANFRKVDPKMAKKKFSTYEKIIIFLEKKILATDFRERFRRNQGSKKGQIPNQNSENQQLLLSRRRD